MSVGGDDETLASSLPTTTTEQPEAGGTIAGRYQIVRWLGAGGMGRVYEVVDTELGERVALKVLRSGLSEDAITRFRREVRLTRRIQHRNVARMFDIGEHEGDRFLTMELVDGAPLSREIGSPLAWPRLQALAIQVCAGLDAAHKAGVVHRDLKPDNILIERGTDRAVITDFGIARSVDDAAVTQVGVVIGTPRYMAPEQLAGGEVDSRADVFSLGVILYELATTRRPWGGDNAISIAVTQATKPMRAMTTASVPRGFIEVIERCLSLDRARRWSHVDEVGAAIAAATYTPTETVRSSRPSTSPATVTTTPTTDTGTPITGGSTIANVESTIAVVPFVCADTDAYLSEGLVEDLIDTLSTTAALRVRPAGLHPTGELDPRDLGRQLDVDHVISGSVRRTPTGLRISARLIGVADGFQIWAHRFDGAEADVLAVAGQIARGVAQALSTRAAGATGPMDPAAVDYYLRARAELRRFWGEHAEEATVLLEKAAAIAPNSGPILSALAYASVQAWLRKRGDDLRARAERAVARALATGFGEAYLASSNLKLNRGELDGGATDLGLALARSPMSAQAHETAGRLLVETDAVIEGRRHFDTAIGLDPGRSQYIQTDLARLDALRGDWAAADERIGRQLADPDVAVAQLGSIVEARIALWRGDIPRVLAAVNRVARRFREGGMDLLKLYSDYVERQAFDLDAWRRTIAEVADPTQPQRMQVTSLQLLVEVAALMGHDEATELALRAAVDYGLLDVAWIDTCPLFRSITDKPWYRVERLRVGDRASRVLAAFRAAAG